MTPRRVLGLVLILVGIVPTIIGLSMAVGEFKGLYSNALEHPLDDPKGGDEQAGTKRMFNGAIMGLAGGLPVVVGLRLVFRRGRRDKAERRIP